MLALLALATVAGATLGTMLVGCGGRTPLIPVDSGIDDAAQVDAGQPPVEAATLADASDASDHSPDAAEPDAVDAAPEASCFNAAGLWVCDGGFPGGDQ